MSAQKILPLTLWLEDADRRVLAKAAKRDGTKFGDFILEAALQAARRDSGPRQRLGATEAEIR